MRRMRATGGRTLVLEGDKDDTLDYAESERARRGDLSVFLPFDHRMGKKTVQLTYYPGAYPTLIELVRLPLAPMQLQTILTSLLELIETCERHSLSRLHVACDPEYVFYDATSMRLRFAYVPLRSYASPMSESDLLIAICEQADIPASERWLCQAVLDYAHRTTVMTGVTLRAFLTSQGLRSTNTDDTSPTGAARHTDTLDTRTSHGWDFVRAAQQRDDAGTTHDHNHIVLRRLSDKRAYLLKAGSYILGRSGECAIPIGGSRGVSRRHARIDVGVGNCVIHDLGSTNGTFVNGSRVVADTGVALRVGDRIALGHEEFELA